MTVPDSGVGVGVVLLLEPEAPPQALRQHRLRVATTHRIQTEYQRRLLNRTKKRVSARAATGMYRRGDGVWLFALILAIRVNVVAAAPPAGVTVGGEKLHDVPISNPEQLNDTAELNPSIGVIVIVVVPL